MARIRTIKPQFFVNEQLAALNYGDRLLFVGLWTQADKSGRLEDRPLRLKAALFPYDDFDVVDGLGRLANAGLITRYEGNTGEALIAIPKWDKHQRPHKTEAESELPGPPLVNGYVPVTERSEGKGRERYGEGNGTLITLPREASRDGFDRFWQAYPRKVGKDAAWSVWQRLKPPSTLVDEMVASIAVQSESSQWRKDGGQFIPHPRTWLHQGRWKDQPDNHAESDGFDGLREFVRHG